jgi:hypothetical protein
LYGRTNANGSEYFGELRLQPINLQEIGTYQMKFWALMFCNETDCEEANDSIRIIANEGRADSDVKIIDYNNIGQQQIWHNMTFQFIVETELTLNVHTIFKTKLSPSFLYPIPLIDCQQA